MTFFDELGLKAAERLEASVGPWVALASYRRLLAADPATRGAAALGMIRCAVALGDDAALTEALPAWREAKQLSGGAMGHVRVLLASKRPLVARDLARAEADRRPGARAAYALALTEDAASPSGDRDAWEAAARVAANEGAAEVLAAAVGWYCARSFEQASRGGVLSRARLTELAAGADPAQVPARLRVHVARAGLASPRRFKRAAALSTLETIARTSSEPARSQALSAVLAHADGFGRRLEAVELDRVQATTRRAGDEACAARAELWVARLAEAPGEAAPLESLERAVERGDVDAPARLAAAAAGVHPDAPLDVSGWRAALRALASPDAAMKKAGASLLRAGLEKSLGVPPFAWLDCARALVAAGEDAVPFFEEAARWDEPHARAHLGDARRSLAYARLRDGDRRGALAELLAAREAFGAGAVDA